MTENPYLDFYQRRLHHQRVCEQARKLSFDNERPSRWPICKCTGSTVSVDEPCKKFAWAIPDEKALTAIADHSPRGVVEIGAGGGYWTKMLRERGVDVIAYDPAPHLSDWHEGAWTEVLLGDYTAVIGHSDRTLLTVWPEYEAAWSHQMIELFEGEKVVYVGEGWGGCTGDDRFHQLLGGVGCTCWGGEECTCDLSAARFKEISTVGIPQWAGIHDYLSVYQRLEA
jgi:hypothetical protein